MVCDKLVLVPKQTKALLPLWSLRRKGHHVIACWNALLAVCSLPGILA